MLYSADKQEDVDVTQVSSLCMPHAVDSAANGCELSSYSLLGMMSSCHACQLACRRTLMLHQLLQLTADKARLSRSIHFVLQPHLCIFGTPRRMHRHINFSLAQCHALNCLCFIELSILCTCHCCNSLLAQQWNRNNGKRVISM